MWKQLLMKAQADDVSVLVIWVGSRCLCRVQIGAIPCMHYEHQQLLLVRSQDGR